MSEITLDDLAGSGDGDSGDSGEQGGGDGDAESGESLMELIEFMDERGYLGPLMFGENDPTNDGDAQTQAQPATGDVDGTELSAENIAELAGLIESKVGDVPISKIKTFAESNPDRVNQLIEQL